MINENMTLLAWAFFYFEDVAFQLDKFLIVKMTKDKSDHHLFSLQHLPVFINTFKKKQTNLPKIEVRRGICAIKG